MPFTPKGGPGARRKPLTGPAAPLNLGGMKGCRTIAAAVGLGVIVAAGADAGLGDHLEARLLPYDLLAEPGRAVALRASLRGGLRLDAIEGARVRFHFDGALLGERMTDRQGNVSLHWKVPADPGDYPVRIGVHPDDQPARPVEDATILVAARPADAAIAIVDLDKTVVGSGFLRVLLGMAKPMRGAAAVLKKLARTHTIVYLTHRPDFLVTSSKGWLEKYGFPQGPVLTSALEDLVVGSGTYKNERLAAIRETYKNVAVGIGDKCSDAEVYARNGLRSILILHVDWSEDDPEDFEKPAEKLAALPEAVQVVTDWDQVAEVLFRGGRYPKGEMERRLRRAAADLRRR